MKKLCFFGAGKIGGKFIDSKIYQEYKEKYDYIFFCDNNSSKWETEYCGICVKSPDEMNNVDLIITCADWNSVLFNNLNDSVNLLGIYVDRVDKVLPYKDACIVSKKTLYNDAAIKFESDNSKKLEKAKENFLKTQDVINNFQGICLELSNICNYSSIHPKCPVSLYKEKIIMPTAKVKEIIDWLGSISYKGTLAFHTYNEPTNDPRLFYFIDYAKKTVPEINIIIYSNAFYINQSMIFDLKEIGCDELIVSAYGDREYERLLGYECEIPYVIYYSNFDDRLNQYEEHENVVRNVPCGSFITSLHIRHDGELRLCCMDWQCKYKLGNIHEEKIEEILKKQKILKMTKDLLCGNRKITELCKGCTIMM